MGGMGSAIAYHLARRGHEVLGLEQFDIPNTRGSSHGITRIIRLAYYEHSDYVPLLLRARELWRELETKAGMPLLHITGSIDAGPPDSNVFAGSLHTCEIHHLRHEILTSGELTRRFPAYRLPSGTMAVFQPDGGFLSPELCIAAHTRMARVHGAEIRSRERVTVWETVGHGVRVTTEGGVYEADKLVLAAGAWLAKLAPRFQALARPERQVLAWFQPHQFDLFSAARLPVFNLLVDEGRFYGLPIFDVPGFKVGKYHHLFEPIDPDEGDLEGHPRDEKILRDFVERYFPMGAGPTLSLQGCMFTNTPDEHFILDFHPEFPQVAITSPCSGHGFKFCSVIGEIMADLLQDGTTRHDISRFRLKRFLE